MGKNDIAFKNEELNIKFNFRVSALFVNNDKVMLQKTEEDYWSLIGGRVKLGETTKEALIREVSEEIGLDLKEEELKLIKVVENFFTYNETKFHELLFIYKISNNKKISKEDNIITLDKSTSINKWINITEIDTLKIEPIVVKKCLNEINISHDIIK